MVDRRGAEREREAGASGGIKLRDDVAGRIGIDGQIAKADRSGDREVLGTEIECSTAQITSSTSVYTNVTPPEA